MKAIQDKLKYGRVLGIPYRFWKITAHHRVETIRRLSNPYKKSTPVFLVGSGRSGTNMLSGGLGKSYQVELYNEDHPVAFKEWRIKDFPTIEKLNNLGYARIKLYKPILDTHMAPEYLSYFQGAKIIFAFRHFANVIDSSIRHFGLDNWPSRVSGWIENDFAEFASAPPPEVTQKFIRARWNNNLSAESSIALYWLFYNRLYFDLGLDQNENAVLMKYENIVAEADIEFRKLCKFLDIKYSSGMIKGIFSTSVKPIQLPMIEKSIKNDCDDLWNRLCCEVDGTFKPHYNESLQATTV
jgi:hypothetical protein